ncbi:MAG: PEP-CTERM sorting domain-containing protein [Thermodesulfobacteriota bacterium]|nr:PEP-CTERM sorting domain-containing protein [Thermodesulfobacteriota bacterium]
MKKLMAMIVCLGMFGFAGVVGATPLTFTDTTMFTATGTNPAEDLDKFGWGDVNKLDGLLDYVKWTHHYDFIPPAEEVLTGSLTLALRDDNDPGWFKAELAIGWAESGEWDLGEVDTGSYTYGVTASYLADGEFTITLASLGGDFYIDRSDLEITYNPAPVPEPSTILLMGTGLLGIIGFGRKKLNKKV